LFIHKAYCNIASSNEQKVGDDALRELMKNHAGGCQQSGENTDGECDRVNKPVDEGVESDAKHGDEADPVLLIRAFVADKGIDEAIK